MPRTPDRPAQPALWQGNPGGPSLRVTRNGGRDSSGPCDAASRLLAASVFRPPAWRWPPASPALPPLRRSARPRRGSGSTGSWGFTAAGLFGLSVIVCVGSNVVVSAAVAGTGPVSSSHSARFASSDEAATGLGRGGAAVRTAASWTLRTFGSFLPATSTAELDLELQRADLQAIARFELGIRLTRWSLTKVPFLLPKSRTAT